MTQRRKTTGRRQERIGSRLLFIFISSIVIWTGVLFGWEKGLLPFLASPVNETKGPKEAPLKVDKKLAQDLQAVIDFEGIQEFYEGEDPFVDRQNLLKIVARPSGNDGQSGPAPSQPRNGDIPTGQSPAKPEAPPDPIAETLSRWERRREAIESGRRFGAESEVFDIADLVPIAVVDGGRGPREVVFHSQALGRNISIAIGSKLFNGWISESVAAGVVFLDLRRKERIFKAWGRPVLKGKGGRTEVKD